MNFSASAIQIVGPKDKPDPTRMLISTVSHSQEDWSRELSPFLLGPVDLYDGHKALNMENAWQYSKLYECHANKSGDPTKDYWNWAISGWTNPKAQRYPMGKGAKPLCCYWNGEKLTYVEARLKIYFKLYQSCVIKTKAFATLVALLQEGRKLALFDFDGYDEMAEKKSLTEVFQQKHRKAGHAFVIKSLLVNGTDIDAWATHGKEQGQIALF